MGQERDDHYTPSMFVNSEGTELTWRESISNAGLQVLTNCFCTNGVEKKANFKEYVSTLSGVALSQLFGY